MTREQMKERLDLVCETLAEIGDELGNDEQTVVQGENNRAYLAGMHKLTAEMTVRMIEAWLTIWQHCDLCEAKGGKGDA